MLPRSRRVHRSQDFSACVRGGVRAGRSTVVVHLLRESLTEDESAGSPAAAGFIVSKAVGNSVVRHRVVRRLRHTMAGMLATLPEGTRVVVRALPAAATASSAELALDLSRGLRTASDKLERRGRRSGAGSSAVAR